MSAAIPIRNIFLLFCYAWNEARFGKALCMGIEDPPHFAHLLATALIEATRRLFRAGAERGYRETQEEVAGIRERIMLTPSLPLIARGTRQLVCRFADQSHDTAINRILKAALGRLASMEKLNSGLVVELRYLARQMGDVAEIPLRLELFRQIQLHRHTARYDLVVNLCRLVMVGGIPSHEGHGYSFKDLLADDVLMRKVFEKFVRNFWRLEATGFTVEPGETKINWDAPAANS